MTIAVDWDIKNQTKPKTIKHDILSFVYPVYWLLFYHISHVLTSAGILQSCQDKEMKNWETNEPGQ